MIRPCIRRERERERERGNKGEERNERTHFITRNDRKVKPTKLSNAKNESLRASYIFYNRFNYRSNKNINRGGGGRKDRGCELGRKESSVRVFV